MYGEGKSLVGVLRVVLRIGFALVAGVVNRGVIDRGANNRRVGDRGASNRRVNTRRVNKCWCEP